MYLREELVKRIIRGVIDGHTEAIEGIHDFQPGLEGLEKDAIEELTWKKSDRVSLYMLVNAFHDDTLIHSFDSMCCHKYR